MFSSCLFFLSACCCFACPCNSSHVFLLLPSLLTLVLLVFMVLGVFCRILCFRGRRILACCCKGDAAAMMTATTINDDDLQGGDSDIGNEDAGDNDSNDGDDGDADGDDIS